MNKTSRAAPPINESIIHLILLLVVAADLETEVEDPLETGEVGDEIAVEVPEVPLEDLTLKIAGDAGSLHEAGYPRELVYTLSTIE